MKNIEIYQGDDGQTRIDIKLDQGALWLSQAQMAELFKKGVRTVNEHIRNIFKDGELEEQATIRKFRIVRQEGIRSVDRVLNIIIFM